MMLVLNGIPIVAIELKNQLTGQSIDDAKRQWMYNRDPKEPCFGQNKRILAYFAVDLYDAAVATVIDRDKTPFLPFNQGSNGAGRDGGAGNPPTDDGDYVEPATSGKKSGRRTSCWTSSRSLSMSRRKKRKPRIRMVPSGLRPKPRSSSPATISWMLSENWWLMCVRTVRGITISSSTVQEAASLTPSHGRLIAWASLHNAKQ